MDTRDETSMSSTNSSVTTIDSQLLDVLDLDSSDSNIIIAQIKSKGRQGLISFEDYIAPIIYAEQMQGESELLNTLKQYFEQQWYSMGYEWFQTFLNQQKQESSTSYDVILTRTAEYGIEYMTESPYLSLVIQFMFEFDDDMLQYKQIFDDMWKYLISFGCKGLERYEDYFAPTVLREQLANATSPLRMALQEHYRQPLRDLLIGSDIREHRNLTSIALNCIVSDGWWNGLNDTRVQNLIPRIKFVPFREKLKEYLTNNNLLMQNNTIITNNNDTSHPHPELHPTSSNITVVTQPTITPSKISLPSQTNVASTSDQSLSLLQNPNQSNGSIGEPMIPSSIDLPNVTHLSLLCDNSKRTEERFSLPLSAAPDKNAKDVCTPSKPSFTQEQIVESKGNDYNSCLHFKSKIFVLIKFN